MSTISLPAQKTAIADLHPGYHLCFLYDTEAEHRSVLTSFLCQGLERGEKVIYILDAHTPAQVKDYLREAGISPGYFIEKGQLVLFEHGVSGTKEKTCLPGGRFDPNILIELLQEEESKAIAQGYPTLRITSEMSWTLSGIPGSERLVEFEAQLNQFFSTSRSIIQCEYDMRRFSPQVLTDILRTHPFALVGKVFYDNFYYLPPTEFLGEDPAAAMFRRQLGSLAGHSHETNQVLGAMLDHSHVLFVYMDTHFNIIRVNNLFAQISGQDAASFPGKNYFNLFPVESIRPIFERAVKNGEPFSDTTRDKLGHWDWSLSPVKNPDGSVVALVLTSQNVSQRVNTVQALEQSETLFRTLAETSPAGIYLTDTRGGCVYTNPRWHEMSGLSSEETSNQVWLEGLHPEDRQRIADSWDEMIASEGHWGLEYRYQNQEGKITWVEGRASPLRSITGEITGYIGVNLDITGRKQVEEALKESERVVRSTLDALSAHIARLDGNGNILMVNQAWSNFAQQNGDDRSGLAEGANYLEICDNARGEGAEDAAAFADGIRAVQRGEQNLYSMEYACHSQYERRWFIGRVTRFGEDSHLRIVIAHENITERKIAEEALRLSEERYRLAIEASSEGLWDWDIASGQVSYSPAWGRMLGEETIVPSFDAWFMRLHPADKAAGKRLLDETLQGSRPFFEWEHRLRTHGGEWIWVLGHGSVVSRDAQGNPLRMTGTISDIHRRKSVEEELALSQAEFAAMFNSNADAVVLVDAQRQVMRINPAFTKLFGYTLDELCNKTTVDLYLSPQEFEEQGRRRYHSQAGADMQPFETLYRRKDGSTFPAETLGVPVRDAQGRLLGFMGIHRDITARKQAEESLKMSETRYRLLFDNMTIGFALHEILLDEAGEPVDYRFLEVNPGFEKLTRLKAQEMVGHTMHEVMPGVASYLVKLFGRVALSGKSEEFEYYTSDLDRHFRLYAYCPQIGQIAVLFSDVSESVQARDALARSQQLLNATFQSLKNAVFILDDKSATILDCNLAAIETFGCAQEMLGKSTAFLHVNEEFLEKFRKILYAAIEKEGSLNHFEFSMKRKDGSVFLSEHNVTPLVNEEGKRTGWVSFVRDISEKSKAEEALREGEERFRALFDQSLAAVSDADGRLLRASPRYCAMLGYSHDELLGKSFREITHPDDLEADLAMIQRMQRGEINAYVLEKRYIRKDGDPVWINMLLSVVRDASGGILQTIGVFQDISDRKRAEEENSLLLAHTRTQAEELGAIVQLSAALRKAQSYNEVVPILVELSTASLNANRGVLLMVEDEQLSLVYTHGWEMPSLQLDTHNVQNEGALWLIIRGGKVRFIPAVGKDDPLRGDDLYDTLTSSSGACVLIPLRVREMPIGLLLLCYEEAQIFNAEQVNLASAVAELAGNTLQRTRLMARMENMVANRTRELGTLYEVISAASSSFDINQALSNALEKIIQVTGNAHGAFYLLSEDRQSLELYVQQNMGIERIGQLLRLPLEDSLEGWVVTHNEALLVPDLALEKRAQQTEVYQNQAHAYLGTPMHVHGEVCGVMSVVRPLRPFSLDEISLLGSIADHLALIVENARLHQRAEQAAVFEERSRLARDLHDSATQALYSTALFADASLAMVEKGDLLQLKTTLGRLTEISHQTLKDMRLLVYQLRPAALQQEGLAAALQYRLESVEMRAGMEFELSNNAEIELDPRMEETLYWIATEALNNALRHSAATSVKVTLETQAGCAILHISDNGSGFDRASPKRGGVGLESMRQRAEKSGGALEIISAPGKGATIIARIPL